MQRCFSERRGERSAWEFTYVARTTKNIAHWLIHTRSNTRAHMRPMWSEMRYTVRFPLHGGIDHRSWDLYRYELRLHYDFHDDMEFRQTRKEVSSSKSSHRRASSHPQINNHGGSITIPLSPTENAIRRIHKRKSQRLLDAWSLKSTFMDVVDGTEANWTRSWKRRGWGDCGHVFLASWRYGKR